VADVNLGQPDVGVESLERYLRWAVQTPSIVTSNQNLRFVMEMARFQRIINDLRFTQAAPGIGESVLFNITVPEDEAWSVTWVNVEHSDTGNKIGSIFVTRAAGPVYQIVRRTVGTQQENNLYPGRGLNTGLSNGEFDQGAAPLEVFGGDTLSVRFDAFAAISVADCFIRYEEMPKARQQNLPANGQTVVV